MIPWAFLAQGSFPPAAGTAGTTAIHKDSSVFVTWATNCVTYRGPQDIAVVNSPLVSLGDDYNATDKSGVNSTVSLGDGGEAILTFDYPIINGQGWDFAIFENAFNNTFLELAFVEVSSDGVNYFRFPATSEVQDTIQTDGFGATHPTYIDNFAGKYRAQYGTPFDLEDLVGIVGLDVNHITHVKVIDVIGTINESYASFDQYGNKVNDPYPTDFDSGGFDLDAVGAIHVDVAAGVPTNLAETRVYPTAVERFVTISTQSNVLGDVQLFSLDGKVVFQTHCGNSSLQINMESLNPGIYFIKTSAGITQLIKL